MSIALTSSKLIASVKRRAMIPTNQNTFTNEDFLALADEELSLGLLPSILRLHEDYFLATEDIAIVSNQSKYSIPDRAIGNKLRDIAFKDSNGNIYEMTRIGIQDISDYKGAYIANRTYAFYIENNQIVLVPEIGNATGGYLHVSYYSRPNQMVMDDKASVITDINRTTGVITVDSIPDDFNTNILFDFVQHKSPFISIGKNSSVISINTSLNQLTFDTDDIPDSLIIGDYINKEYETIVPQIPSDIHVVLAHRVAARCLEALGDTEGLSNANKKLMEMEDKTTNLIDNRVESAPLKVVNRHGTLRGGLYRRRWKFRS